MPNRAVVFVSEASPHLAAEHLAAIMADAARFNRNAGVSGVTLYDGRRFLAYMEGPPDGLDVSFSRAAGASSHGELIELARGRGGAAQASVLADALHPPVAAGAGAVGAGRLDFLPAAGRQSRWPSHRDGDAGGTGRIIRRGCISSAAPASNGVPEMPSFILGPQCRVGHPALDRRAPVIARGDTVQASGARSPFRPSTLWLRKPGM